MSPATPTKQKPPSKKALRAAVLASLEEQGFALSDGAIVPTGALDKDGVYKVDVKGSLTLHNVTRTIGTAATLEVKGGHLLGVAEFRIKQEDFSINIPSIVRDKIDREITVKVNIDCTTK